jgi:hypothetical protein
MKSFVKLNALALFCTLAFLVQAQSDDKYPITIGPLNINTPPDVPSMLLYATVLEHDYYEITLRNEDDGNKRVKKTIRPYTEENFKRAIRTAYNDLLNQNGFNQYEIQDNLNDSINAPLYIGVETAPLTDYEKSLFYQLKGSEISTSSGNEHPIAGELCFSPTLNVERALDHYNLAEFNKKVADFITQEISKLGKINLKKQRKTKELLKQNFELSYATRMDYAFRNQKNKVKDVCKKYKKKSNEIDSLTQQTRNLRRALAQAIREDTTIIDDDKNTFMEEMRLIYNSYIIFDRYSDTEIITTKSKELVEKHNSCKKYFNYIENITRAKRLLENEKSKFSDEAQNEIAKLLQTVKAKKTFQFDLDYLELEFNEGFIENILVVGYVEALNTQEVYNENALLSLLYWADDSFSDDFFDDSRSNTTRIKFESRYPLGFSRKTDYEKLRQITLKSSGKVGEDTYSLALGDLFTLYLPKLEVGRRDYSPENKVVIYNPKTSDGCVTLHKEATSKMFEARVYSDFVGLDENSANGLIQTEVSKRLNINTNRQKSFKKSFGMAAWIEPTITLSKIEKNNKNLVLDKPTTPDITGRKRFLGSTLKIRQHESFSVGTRVNAFYFDILPLKTNLSFNGNAFYGRTPIYSADTSVDNGINTITLGGEIAADIKADERWGLSLMYRYNYMNVLSRDIVQIADETDPLNTLGQNIRNNKYNTAQFWAFFQPTTDNRGRLFFRYRYHWQLGDWNLGFHQAQVGYSFYLLGRNKGTEKSGK